MRRGAPGDINSAPPLTDAQHALRDHLPRVGAKDVHAEDAVRGGICQDLHEALRVLHAHARIAARGGLGEG